MSNIELPDPEENIYSESDILLILYGLMNVYWSKHPLFRWAYKPWHDAIQTVAMTLCSNVLHGEVDGKDTANSVEQFLQGRK